MGVGGWEYESCFIQLEAVPRGEAQPGLVQLEAPQARRRDSSPLEVTTSRQCLELGARPLPPASSSCPALPA
ncbi:UNVERIFIED_CONTAM: hypothetical protein Sradi_4150900 [Sesamum radiatum]|uniref:Uncharacterized protein n=1 Tax=Sesamum radiatum TaxID=300843 RepID=A0AAW2P2D7_SESRA